MLTFNKNNKKLDARTLQGKRFLSNMYLYRFNCPLINDCSLVTYVDSRGSAFLTY